ncbi:hypothetical protein D3C73_894180 [compost metagenome]
MNSLSTFDKCRFAMNQAWQITRSYVPMVECRRVRISFDIDDTLACLPHHSEAEPNLLPESIHRWLGEPLRQGTRELIRELRRQDCSVWVYTSSGRTPSYIRRWLMLYGIHVDGVVNSVRHDEALKSHGLSITPSKLPRLFDIDLHVDDSEGVKDEGQDHGFRVVVVQPDDPRWAQRVLDAVADVQAQLAWQQPHRFKAPVGQGAGVYSS